jgi:hypothetical protein
MKINTLSSNVSEVSIIPIEDIQIHSEVIPFIREKQINHIKYTMNRFGQQLPVLGNLVDGKFHITDGVVRFEVAKLLGWKTLNCLDKCVPNEEVVKLRMVSNQRTKMTYTEIATYAEHTLGILGKSQGKKRDSWLGMDDIENDDNFGLAGKDRFVLTCYLLDLPIKSSSLRKLIALKQFEDENPHNGIGIMSGLDQGLFMIDKAYQLFVLKNQLEVRKGEEDVNVENITTKLMGYKQTPVDWLFLMLNNPNKDQEFSNKLLDKAKQIEKEQMIKFAKLCLDKSLDLDIKTVHLNIEQYYNESYEKYI